MKRIAALAAALLLGMASGAAAGEFSLFGGKLGMKREELKKVWTELESGQYHIKDSMVFAVTCDFDHADRLYRVSFSLPVKEERPFGLASTAFQNVVNRLWGGDPDLAISARAGKGALEATVTSRKMMEEYTKLLETELGLLLRP